MRSMMNLGDTMLGEPGTQKSNSTEIIIEQQSLGPRWGESGEFLCSEKFQFLKIGRILDTGFTIIIYAILLLSLHT